MSGNGMPDYDAEPNEWESNRAVKFPKHIEIQIKSYLGRIQSAHTIGALMTVRKDIERGALVSNAQALGQLKQAANRQAAEIGFKEGRWWN